MAAALCVAQIKSIDAGSINLITKGGNLNVYFTKQDNQYTDIWLEGPAEFVFKGEIKI